MERCSCIPCCGCYDRCCF
ncbi:Protein of unknown function [Gryllus bimaculatus]|nr:Protein of unknown function [Gryllus bimaculatus]